MTVPEVNLWAVLLATASTLLVGSLWYTPKVFGTRWMALARVDRDKVASRGAIPILVTVVVSFVTAWVLAGATSIAHAFYDGAFLSDALLTGAFLWANNNPRDPRVRRRATRAVPGASSHNSRASTQAQRFRSSF